MFQCTLQESKELTIEKLRSFTTVAHKYLYIIINKKCSHRKKQTTHNWDLNPTLYHRCVSSFILHDRMLRDWTYSLTYLYDKKRRSNHFLDVSAKAAPSS